MNKTTFLTIPAAALMFSGAFLMSSGVARAADTIRITYADVDEMTYKVNMATRFFESTWRQVFRRAGYNYPAPRLVGYYKSVTSACGELGEDNAHYCTGDNTIYYDKAFLTGQMVIAAKALGTDGDYAPIVILAHEMGHGVATMFKINSALTVLKENLADCLAGVVTREGQKAGNLERGDLEEGLFALTMGGDGAETSIWSQHAHGSGELRRKMFLTGYNEGIAACDTGLGRNLEARQR